MSFCFFLEHGSPSLHKTTENVLKNFYGVICNEKKSEQTLLLFLLSDYWNIYFQKELGSSFFVLAQEFTE